MLMIKDYYRYICKVPLAIPLFHANVCTVNGNRDKSKENKEMQKITLTQEASWTNFRCPTVTMPVGTVLTVVAWKPEGFNTLTEDGTDFFLFYNCMSAEGKQMHDTYWNRNAIKPGATPAQLYGDGKMKKRFTATVKLPDGSEKIFTRASAKDYKGFYYGIASIPSGQSYTKHGFFTAESPIKVGSKFIWDDCRFHTVLIVPVEAE